MTEQLATDPPVDPALVASDPPPADPPATPADSPSDPPAPPPRMIPADVLVREVTPLRAKIRESDAALDETRRQLAEARQLIERFQRNGNGSDPATHPAPPQRHTEPTYTQADIDRRALELNFQRDAAHVSEAGLRSYGAQWRDAINIMESFGLNSADFVQSIMDVTGREKAHEVVHAIAAEPERAASLSSMTPARRIAEITRMSERMTAKSSPAAKDAPAAAPTAPAKNVSSAPAPAPRVQPSAGHVTDWRSDKASDEDFSRGWEERYGKRARR